MYEWKGEGIMAAKKNKSMEEQVEDRIKRQFGQVKYYTKTESINAEIDNALKTAQSKSGGEGAKKVNLKEFMLL